MINVATHPSAVGVRVLAACVGCRRSSCVGFAHSDHGCLFLWFYTRSGFIRGLHFGTSPFFTHAHTGGARAHGRAVGSLEGAANLAAIFTCAYTGGPMRDFTSERSEVKSRPSQHQHLGPRASRPTWGPGRTPRAGDAPRCTEGRGAARFHFGTLRGEVPLIPKPTAGTRSDHAAHRAMVRRSER